VVRYEDLHTNPISTIDRVANCLLSVERKRILDAVKASMAARMRSRDPWLEKQIWSATVGEWRNRLSDRRLEVFRTILRSLLPELRHEMRLVLPGVSAFLNAFPNSDVQTIHIFEMIFVTE
jgi:hypothetical protein